MKDGLKPCQAVARGMIRFRTDYETQKRIGRIDCKKCGRQAEMWLDRYTSGEGIAEYSKGQLLYELCKGCKEVNKNDDEE